MARSRRCIHFGLLFIGSVLVANALVGERGLVDSIDERRRHQQLTSETTRLRHENEHLRHEARRLRDDPAAIEAVARGELGLIRPGELLLLFADQGTTSEAHQPSRPAPLGSYSGETAHVR